MLFKFVKPSTVIDIFTDHERAYNNYRIDRYKNFIPSWWKKTNRSYVQPKEIDPGLTLKTCLGVINIFQIGFILPLWSDLIIQQKFLERGYSLEWKFADNISKGHSHPPQQWENFLDPGQYFHFKIDSPWFIRTNKKIKWHFNSPYWNLNPFRINIVQGVLDFHDTHEVNINMFFNHEKNPIFIEQNTPLLHLIPLTDKKLKLQHHLVDTKELSKLGTSKKASFIGDHILKQKKCPYK